MLSLTISIGLLSFHTSMLTRFFLVCMRRLSPLMRLPKCHYETSVKQSTTEAAISMLLLLMITSVHSSRFWYITNILKVALEVWALAKKSLSLDVHNVALNGQMIKMYYKKPPLISLKRLKFSLAIFTTKKQRCLICKNGSLRHPLELTTRSTGLMP